MNTKEILQASLHRLQKKGAQVDQPEIGAEPTEDDLEVIRLLDATLPPQAINQFFSSTDGIGLLWSGTVNNQEVQGSINILTLLRSALRTPVDEEGEPLEGVLWSDEWDLKPRVLKQLKNMAIFEEIAGTSDYLTYRIDEDSSRLYLVHNGSIKPLVPSFEQTIELLLHYAGAFGLREHLTHTDWQERIDKDATLQLLR